MKNLLLSLSLSMLIMSTQSCKKDKKEEATPIAPTPTTANTTIAIALVDYAPNPTVVTSPKLTVVLTSPSGVLGDTITQMNLVSWSMATSYPTSDSTAFASYGGTLATTISYPLANDGSYYMLYFYEGTTVKETVRVYPTQTIDGAGPGSAPGAYAATINVRETPNGLIVLGW